MDKLSELIKEAKPLYKKRKIRKTIAKFVLGITVPIFLMTNIYQTCSIGNDIYLSLDNDSLEYELLEDEFGLLGLQN